MTKSEINSLLFDYFVGKNVKNVLILADENVNNLYPDYFSQLEHKFNVSKIVVPSGESSKSIEKAVEIWTYLAENQFSKDTFLINFGGGMISDLGGFVAANYKRGIRFVNVPTTLLAMIDAAVGGKTGVNFHHLKNCIGTFYFPDIQTLTDASLLKTLPNTDLLSGFGEMLKYALIADSELFSNLENFDSVTDLLDEQKYIDFCVDFKQKVVEQDPFDKNLRHILNFGHTFGHAVESFSHENGNSLAHGIAVAHGIVFESFLSMKCQFLSHNEYKKIENFVKKFFPPLVFNKKNAEKLIFYMKNDKKNNDDDYVNFTIIDKIGHAIPDFKISENDLFEILLSFSSSII